jgi:hypothetical protein
VTEWLIIIALWLAGTYGLWKLFEASCAVDEDEPVWLAFVIVSFWPLVVPIVFAQDMVDAFQEWRHARV